ncbi:MAG TPA: hypothetical protein DEA38_03800 [Stenotrophomonas sp.]|nr:hypothetical protein [Stenotrophomonas sp.]
MDAQVPSMYDADQRDHHAEAVLEAFFATQRTPAIVLQRFYPPSAFPKVRSRLGGLPQLPDDLEWPVGESYGEQAPMHFLAQIDCAELPRVDTDMPEQGVLFFFAMNDEEQIWDTDEPQQRVRVLYAREVAVDQEVRALPEGMRPILDEGPSEYAYRNPAWLLPDEEGPRVHVQWPLVARRMDTWPDYLELPPGEEDTPYYDVYPSRLSEMRLGAAVAATGLFPRADAATEWERSTSLDWTFPVQWLRYQNDFPQVGIIIDRLARVIGNERRRGTRGEVDYADVRAWVERAARIGWDEAPDDATREAFREWIVGHISDELGGLTLTDLDMGRAFTKGLLAAVAYAAGSPVAAARIPAMMYRSMQDEHLPFDESSRTLPDGRKRCAETRVHQMLGHVPRLHDVVPEVEGEGGEVCLLQLACDPAIELVFGDCGQATFWLSREDLRNRRFDRVVGVVESH